MKKLIICTALLWGSVTGPLVAQKTATYPFTGSYKDLLESTSLEIKLSKGNVLLLIGRDYEQSKLLQRPDTLVRMFWNEYGEVLNGLPDDTDGTAVHYVLDGQEEPAVFWRKYPAPIAEYAVLGQELVRVKSAQDTLHISVREDDKQRAELYLLINDLRDVPRLFDEIRLKTTALRTELEEKVRARKLARAPQVFVSYRGDRNLKYDLGSNRLTISLGTSIGYNQGGWSTAYTTNITYQIEGSRYGPRVGTTTQQFFERNAEGKMQVYQQEFFLLGVTQFSRPKTRDNRGTPTRQTSHLTIGLLLDQNGGYYESNTWRIATGFDITPRISVETEWYYTGFLENVSYGLRVAVGIF